MPPYGGSIAQNVYYADSDLCDDNVDPSGGYPKRDMANGKMKPWESPFILMMDRGGCTFVKKVRNAQRAGASGVIIADNTCLCSDEACMRDSDQTTCEMSEPIMADDGSGGDISIPSFLMFKRDADKIKDEVLQNHPVQIEMSWKLYTDTFTPTQTDTFTPTKTDTIAPTKMDTLTPVDTYRPTMVESTSDSYRPSAMDSRLNAPTTSQGRSPGISSLSPSVVSSLNSELPSYASLSAVPSTVADLAGAPPFPTKPTTLPPAPAFAPEQTASSGTLSKLVLSCSLLAPLFVYALNR
jgi:hypothetical protein